MLLQGRKHCASAYSYGFQGQVKDDDITAVDGGHLAFTYRIHDARSGRFLSVDPLFREYAYNSSYAFSENRVIDAIELEGLEKVILFGGADLASGSIGDGLSETTKNLANSLQNYSDLGGLGYQVQAYRTNLFTFDTPEGLTYYQAYKEIKANYKPDEPIIIYGYSMGGFAAAQLSKLLDQDDIKVILLITIDAALGPNSQPLEISKNVDVHHNYYQSGRLNPMTSRGYPSVRMEGNDETYITNTREMNLPILPTGKHGHIDEYTIEPVQATIELWMRLNTGSTQSSSTGPLKEPQIGPIKEDGTF